MTGLKISLEISPIWQEKVKFFGKGKRLISLIHSYVVNVEIVIFVANKENRESEETTLTILEEQQNAIS